MRPVRSCACLLAAGVLTALGSVAPAAASNGKVVSVCGANLCATDGSGAGLRQLTSDGAGARDYQFPSLSRDGTRMTFRRADGKIFAADGNASGATMLGPFDLPAFRPRLSPDGTRVTWTMIYGAGSSIYTGLVNFDGTGAVSYGSFGGEAGFAPGGQQFCPQASKNELWISPTVQGSDGGACNRPPATRVASVPDIHAFFSPRPEYSPDNRLIVDAVRPGGEPATAGIFLFDPATSEQVRQLTSTAGDDDATWSPDGMTVLFDRGADVYSVPAAGGNATVFLPGAVEATWSNDAAGGSAGASPGPTPAAGSPGSTGPQACRASAGSMRCAADRVYARALARCATRGGSSGARCRKLATRTHHRAIALIACQNITNGKKRGGCVQRAKRIKT